MRSDENLQDISDFREERNLNEKKVEKENSMISRPRKNAEQQTVELVEHKLVGMRQAGEILGVHPWTVRTLCWKGALPYVRVGRLVKVDMADLLAFIARHKECNAPAAMPNILGGL